MIFCPPTEVNEVWDIIAKATANNELGIAAKVAPKSPLEDPRKDRLICIYTADFYDKPDISRVLQKLRDLRLVEARSKPIYYKPGKKAPTNAQSRLIPWQIFLHTSALPVAILGASKPPFIAHPIHLPLS